MVRMRSRALLLLLVALSACTGTPQPTSRSTPSPTVSEASSVTPSPTPSPTVPAAPAKISCLKPSATIPTSKPARSSDWRLILQKGTGPTPQSPTRHYLAPLGPGRHQPYLERQDAEKGTLPRIETDPTGELIMVWRKAGILVADAATPTRWRTLAPVKKGEVVNGEWSADGRWFAYVVSTLDPGDNYPNPKYGYRVWIVDRDGRNRRHVKTVRMPPYLIAYDRHGGWIYMANGGEAPHTHDYHRLTVATGKMSRVRGMQETIHRMGLTFSKDSRSAWWAEYETGLYRFDFARGAKKLIWRLPAEFDKRKAAIADMFVAPNECYAIVSVASEPYGNTRTNYIVDLKSGSGRLLLPRDRFPTQEPKGWSPDSRLLWFEATCDYQCVRRPSAKSEYWVYDATTGKLHLFYRSKTFYGERAETVDWIRFVAWLRAS